MRRVLVHHLLQDRVLPRAQLGKLQVSGSGLLGGPGRALPGTSYCSSFHRLHTLQREEPPTKPYATATSGHLDARTYNWEDHLTYHKSRPTTGKTT